jgi:hypothetical protein
MATSSGRGDFPLLPTWWGGAVPYRTTKDLNGASLGVWSDFLLQTAPKLLLSDTFTRGDQSNFGTSSGGAVWDTVALSSILSNKGRFTLGASGQAATWLGSDSYYNFDAKISFSASNVTNWDAEIHGRYQANPTGDYLKAGYDSGADLVFIQQRVAGSNSDIGSSFPLTVNAATTYWIRFQCEGNQARVKVWDAATSEPAAWQVTATTTRLGSGRIGVNAFASTAFNIDWDNLNFGEPGYNETPRVPHFSPYPQLLAH